MTIDEKQIGKKMYTIMNNAQTGKIAFMAQTMKPEELKQAVENYLSTQTDSVQSISCDISPSYKKFCKEMFPNTQLVIDKFHVIKHLMDALQQVRKQLKTHCLIKNATTSNQISASNTGDEKIWTDIELLERSRYILFKMEVDWDADDKEIVTPLFEKFPILKTAYYLTQQLRNWYNGKNIGKHIVLLEKKIIPLVR